MTTTGESLRAEGQSAVIAADTAIHRNAGEAIRDALDWCIAVGQPFTAEDVRALLPTNVEPHSPNLLPAIMGGYASSGRITAVGMCKPTRPSRRHSRNLIWQPTKPEQETEC